MGKFRRQLIHDPHRLHAHPHHLADEADDVLLILFAVRIALDAGAFVFAYLILVDHPLEGAAVAEAVLAYRRRDVGEGEGFVDGERGFVLAQLHFFDAIAERFAGGFDPFQGPRVQLVVIQMQLRQRLACGGEGAEIRGIRNPGEVPLMRAISGTILLKKASEG